MSRLHHVSDAANINHRICQKRMSIGRTTLPCFVTTSLSECRLINYVLAHHFCFKHGSISGKSYSKTSVCYLTFYLCAIANHIINGSEASLSSTEYDAAFIKEFKFLFLSLSLFGTYFLSLRAATATSFYSFEKCPTVTEIEGDGEEKEKPPPKRWGLKKKGWKVHSECDKEGRMQLKITKPCNGSLQLNDERNHGLLHLGCQLCYMQRKM